MILPKCAICVLKRSKFVKTQEASRMLSSLRLKTPLNKIPVSGDLLFQDYKMNKIINKFILAEDKFMPEMHLKQPGFTCSACGPFTKNKERIQNFKETGGTKYITEIY